MGGEKHIRGSSTGWGHSLTFKHRVGSAVSHAPLIGTSGVEEVHSTLLLLRWALKGKSRHWGMFMHFGLLYHWAPKLGVGAIKWEAIVWVAIQWPLTGTLCHTMATVRILAYPLYPSTKRDAYIAGSVPRRFGRLMGSSEKIPLDACF